MLRLNIFFLCLLLFSFSLNGQDVKKNEGKIVNVFVWHNQIPQDLIKSFEEETGLTVNLDVYDSNEVLEAKLLAGHTGYDVVFPTAWPYMARQISAGLYLKINRSYLSNYKNVDPLFLQKMESADPGNAYAIPYTWGLVAIGYNKEIIQKYVPPEKQNSWALLYDPEVLSKLASCGITFLEDPLDVFFTYAIYKNISLKESPFKALKTITNDLKKIRPFIKRFSNSLTAEQLGKGELCIIMHWGAILSKTKSQFYNITPQSNMTISLPKEGTLMWIDCIGIPKDAPHPNNAHKFIDFLLRSKTAATLTNTVYTVTTIKTALPLLRKEIRDNKIIFPPEAYLREKVKVPGIYPLRFQRLLSRSFASIITHKK